MKENILPHRWSFELTCLNLLNGLNLLYEGGETDVD